MQMSGRLLSQIIKDVYNGTAVHNEPSRSFLQLAAASVETKRRRGKTSLEEKKDSEPLTRLVVLFVHDLVFLSWKQKPTEVK